MTANLARSFSFWNSCASFRLRSRWSLAGHVSRRYIQEFPEQRLDNSSPKDHLLVLAEKCTESPDTNEILRIPLNGEPEINFSKLNPELCFKGMSQVICNFDNYLADIENQEELSYESIEAIFKDIEKNLIPLDYAHNILRVLMSVDESSYRYREIVQLLNYYVQKREKRMDGVLKEQLQNKVNNMKKDQLSSPDKAMLRAYNITTRRKPSIQPVDKSSLYHLRENLNNETKIFLYQLNLANKQFSHTVDDPDILAAVASEFDESHDLHHKERTPLEVTPATYHKFMRVCPDRFIRHGLWKAYNKRCSPKDLPKHNNMNLLNNMRVWRRKIADMSGYRSHLEYRLEYTMAGSRRGVLDSLTAINMELSDKLSERLVEIYEFAADNSFADPGRLGLREYDIDYWVNRYQQDVLVGMRDTELKKFFPFETVMSGLRNYFSNYFSIEFNVKPMQNDNFWTNHTQLIEMTRHGQPLGTIIYDPFMRSTDRPSEMYYARLRSPVAGTGHQPARFISTSYNLDSETGKANLGVTDVMNLFHLFSAVIQRFLYNYQYYELNTYGALQADVKNLLPNLCIGHILTDHKILQSCSVREGSKPIDSELTNKILRAHIYAKPFKTWFELYKAHLDMDANTTLVDTKVLAEEAYTLYCPFPREADNYDYCTMNDLFVGPMDGLYYRDLWSRQVANFCLRHVQNDDGKLEESKMKEFLGEFIDTHFDPINFDTSKKLVTLTGKSFEPSKTGLGVL